MEKFLKGAEVGFDTFIDMIKNGKSILDGMSSVKESLNKDNSKSK